MVSAYTIKDTTNDLAFLLSLTGAISADSEGFWHNDFTDTRFVHQLDSNDAGHEIALFQDPLPKGDYYYFNPFSEGFGKKSPATQLYLKLVRVRFNQLLRGTLLWVVDNVLRHKENADGSGALHHAVLRMTSGSVNKKETLYDVLDETMKAEFRKIFDRIDDNVIQVPYLIQQMTAKVSCDVLTDDQWDEKYGKDVRKKSLVAFKAAIMGVLGISSVGELSHFTVKYDPELKTAASFYTMMSVYLKLYSRFNDVLAEVYTVDGVVQPMYEVNLGELTSVIDRFPMAYTIAKHMSQPVLPSVGATSTNTVDTSKLSIAKPGGSRFGAPDTVDQYGRSVKTPVMAPVLNKPAGRFATEIEQQQLDPFAPPVIAAPSSGVSIGGNYFGNGGGMPGFGQPMGFGGGMSGGLNLNPPSNFNNTFSRW